MKHERFNIIVWVFRKDFTAAPDDDFIDILAIAQNITCEFADRVDAQCWLDREKV